MRAAVYFAVRAAAPLLRGRATVWLAAGLVGALVVAGASVAQRRQAEAQRRVILSRLMWSQAMLIRVRQPQRLPTAILLTVEALRREPFFDAEQSLRDGLAVLPRPVGQVTHSGVVRAAVFSGDGRYVATASWDGTARIWEVQGRRELVRISHDVPVRAVAFSPDARYLATAGGERGAWLWEVRGGREVLRASHHARVAALAFSPDGRLLATAGWDAAVRVWDAGRGRLVARLPHTGRVQAVTFSPDGRTIASAGDDRAARIWEVATGRETAP